MASDIGPMPRSVLSTSRWRTTLRRSPPASSGIERQPKMQSSKRSSNSSRPPIPSRGTVAHCEHGSTAAFASRASTRSADVDASRSISVWQRSIIRRFSRIRSTINWLQSSKPHSTPSPSGSAHWSCCDMLSNYPARRSPDVMEMSRTAVYAAIGRPEKRLRSRLDHSAPHPIGGQS